MTDPVTRAVAVLNEALERDPDDVDAIIYLAIVETLRILWDGIERRLTRHLVR